jgi:hypothetical protein
MSIIKSCHDQDSITKLTTLRTILFYLVLMMDYATNDADLMFLLQYQATFLNQEYCNELEIAFKNNLELIRSELDKIETFQSSKDCSAPNILKDNFVEGFTSKELIQWANDSLINVDFQKPYSFDEEADKQFQAQMVQNMNQIDELMDLSEEELRKLIELESSKTGNKLLKKTKK